MTVTQIPTDDPAAIERVVGRLIDRFTPAIAERARACRAALRARLPGASELVRNNPDTVTIGYGATDRASDAIVSLAVHPASVLLHFSRGATLPDPGGLLRGEGRRGRYLCLFDADTLDDPRVSALLATALAVAERPLPGSGTGRTLVASASARPPRPATQEPA